MNTDFAHYYQRIRSKQKRETLLWSLGLVALYLGAGNIAEFNLHTVWVSIPISLTIWQKPSRYCTGRCYSPTAILKAPSPIGATGYISNYR